MSLNVDIRANEVLRIGESKITLIKKSGRLVRLSIDAPSDVLVEHTRPLTKDPELNGFYQAAHEGS